MQKNGCSNIIETGIRTEVLDVAVDANAKDGEYMEKVSTYKGKNSMLETEKAREYIPIINDIVRNSKNQSEACIKIFLYGVDIGESKHKPKA